MNSESNSFLKSESKWYLLATTLITSIFFIIPCELYFNGKEYWNWNYIIPLSFAIVGSLIYLLLAITIKICSKIHIKLPRYLSVFLFFLGLFILLADVFSPLQTNLLDGSELVSTEPLKYSLIEAAIFIMVLIAVAKLGPRLIISISVPVSLILIVISILYFGLIMISSKPVVATSSNRNLNPDIRGNVYHIVLDEMQTDAALLYLQEKDAGKHFSGFTLFRNNMSNYLYTQASFPSYLTGTVYTGGSFKHWKDKFKKEGLLKGLYEKGYRITMYSVRQHWNNSYVSKFVALDDIYEQDTGIKHALYRDFIQIWIARIMPNVLTNEALSVGRQLGQFLYNVINGVNVFPVTISEGKEPFSSVLMLKRVIDTEKDRSPNGEYVYAHAVLPHGPYVMDSHGEYNLDLRHGGTAAYYGQVRCAFHLVIEFLEELKRLESYDQSTIIIHADTGHGQRGFINKVGSKIVGTIESKNRNHSGAFLGNAVGWTKDQVLSRTVALLMIKPARSSGELRFSEKESQLIDLYPTIVDLLQLRGAKGKIGGSSLFTEDFPKSRHRMFFIYPPAEEEPDIRNIIIPSQKELSRGNLVIAGYVDRYPIIDFPVNGVIFDIGAPDEGRIQLKGFSWKEAAHDKSRYYRWAVGKNNRMVFNGLRLPTRRRLLVTFEVEPFVVNRNKEMLIQSQLSSAKVILRPGLHEYRVILEFPEGEDIILDIHCENTATPKSLGINEDQRNLSVQWTKIRLEYTHQKL